MKRCHVHGINPHFRLSIGHVRAVRCGAAQRSAAESKSGRRRAGDVNAFPSESEHSPPNPLVGGEDGNTARLSHSSADSCKLGAATKSGGQLNQKVGRRASGTAVLGWFFFCFSSESRREREGWKEES